MAQSQKPSEGMSRGGGQQNWASRFQQMKSNAEQNLADGAVTPAYKANRQEIIDLLNRALASEWSSFLQYWHHYFMASDIHSAEIREVFKQHAEEEYEHAQKFNERINELGGVPANSPKLIDQLSPTGFSEGHDLRSMMESDLVGERETIEFYNEIVRTCGFDDNETRTMVEGILLDENEHANDWSSFLYQFNASTDKQMPTLHDEIMEERGKRYRAAS